VNEEAQVLLEAHGKPTADLFHSLATGNAELISDHYPVWLAQYNGTDKTKALHKATLERFLTWAGQHTSVQATTRRKAGEFVQHMLDEGLARKTIARHLSALSSLWRWLISRGIAELEPRDNPWREHNIGAKKEHTKRKGLSDEAVLKLLNASYPTSRYNVMFHDLVRLALLTGIRVDALCSLKRSDVEKRKDGYWLGIEFDKTPSGTRTVPLHTAGDAIMARRMKHKGEFLFPDLAPDKWGDRSGNFTKAYTRFRRRAEVNEKGQVFHTFRNTFLECLEAQGVPESTAKLLVGHKRASLTYGHYSKGERLELRASVRKLNYGRAIMAAIKRAPA
jgi:integrase